MQLNRPLKRLAAKRQQGDTIVEVLVCVLIVSIVLAGAYVTSHRSSQGIRDSQEHAEALKLVQSQLEQIRANAAASASPAVFSAGEPFCMVEREPVSGNNPPQCSQNAAGQPTTAEPQYRVRITRSGPAATPVFAVQVQWDSVTGSPAQETLFYRIPRP